MTSAEEVKKLAALARVEVSEEELPGFVRDFDAIIAYIGQLEALEIQSGTKVDDSLRNVMREDGEPHAPGQYTEALAKQFPAREGDALVVKQVISHA